MTGQLTLTGMVLSAMPIGDYDRRLVLLTRERGKISAFARGARRQNSPFMAGSRPFSFGEFVLYEGRDSYNMISMNILNYFTQLSEDFYAAYYGFYFLELSDYFGREGVEGTDTINLLYYTFKALTNDSIDNKLIRYIFELKSFVINGEYPQIRSFKNPSTEYTMQYIISTPIEKLYTFKVTEDVIGELSAIMDKYRKLHIDKTLKSLEILEKI